MATPNTADSNRYLDNNNRLSSAGAAQSLKYARPQDLPSYPTSGLPPNRQKQDATTAANLGWQNQKSYEPWKPAPSGAAATAATRGWGTTAPTQWQPEQSMSGARAAVLAAQRNKNLPAQGVTAPSAPAPRPAPSAWGNTAANLAVSNSRAKRPGTATPPNTTYRQSEINRHGSLMAATGAMASGPRRRADSNPVARPTYPDQANARSNALRAATAAQSNSQIPKVVPAGGASPAVHMPRNKFGYNPGSQPVADAKTHEEALQSSAVAMAQQMYKIMEKNKSDKEATAGASGAMGRNRAMSLSSASDAAVPPMQFGNIQHKAEILAARRLADMHDEEAQAREYRQYYAGQLDTPQSQHHTKRFSLGNMFSRNRRNSDDSLDDDVETRKIRAQMAVFQSSLSKVDPSTRQSDRDRVMAIAQQKVKRDLEDIDQVVYSKTGKPTPQMKAQWEREQYARQQAETHAQQQHEERMMNHGRIDIGGGQYMDQEQLDETARRNVQPVLDNIETHNQERLESEEGKRLDAEERKRQAVIDRQREKESKELEKTVKQQMKEEAKAKREEGKLTRKQSRKGSLLSRFGSISRSTHANHPAAASSSLESTHLASDAAPTLAPVPATQPLSISDQNAGVDESQHMSGAVRTTTTDTERATRESASFVTASAEPAPAAVAPVAPVAHVEPASVPLPGAPVEPAAVPLPRHGSDTNIAKEANADMRDEIPVSETIYDPYLNHTAVPTKMTVVPIVPFQADHEKVTAPTKPTGAPAPVIATDAPTAATGPAQNTTSYENLPAGPPPATDVQTAANTSGTTTDANTARKSSPEESPKQKKGVKGWLKKAFHRGSSGDNEPKLDRKASKRNSKVVKDDPKGTKAVIGEPQPVNTLSADGKPAETTNIGIGKENMGEGNLSQAQATQAGSTAGPSGSGVAATGTTAGGTTATSGPLDSHPDVHTVDRTLYDASPPRKITVGAAGPALGTSPPDQRQSMIDYERDQERARADDEVNVSDIDDELVARSQGRQVPSQDASTVSMLSQSSMERKRIAALEEEKAAGMRGQSGSLPKVSSDREMERAAEREEIEEMRREERDEVDSIQGPKFPAGRERAGSEARETRFREDV